MPNHLPDFNEQIRNYMIAEVNTGTPKPLILSRETVENRSVEDVIERVRCYASVACSRDVECIGSVMPDGSVRIITSCTPEY